MARTAKREQTPKRDTDVQPAPSKQIRMHSRKSGIILKAAEQVFLRSGFAATTMDDVASEAQVSKKTVYSNFNSKAELFAQVIEKRCARNVPSQDQLEAALKASPADGLLLLSVAFLKNVFAPAQVELYQTVVAAVRRHPDIGRVIFDGPVTATQNMFASYLEQVVEAGQLDIPDTGLAATQLIALLKSNTHMKLAFGRPVRIGPKAIKESAAASIDLFLKGYATKAKHRAARHN